MAAVIVYHKNLEIYPKEWIFQFRNSILNQTVMPKVYECDYGASGERIFPNSVYFQKKFSTFNHCQNFLLDWAFKDNDRVFNSNVDDYYAPQWMETELKQNYDIVSCNFSLVKSDKIVHQHKFNFLDIKKYLNASHNIIAHPAVLYSSNFWNKYRYIPEEIPYEDMKLWQRALKDCTFYICEENLLYHRIHENMVSAKSNTREKIV